MASTTSGGSQTDLSSLLSDTSSTWTAASIASHLTVSLLCSLPSQVHTLSSAAVRLLLLALLQCRPAVLVQVRESTRAVLDECDRSEDEWVRWLAGRLRDYESTETRPARPGEQERAMVRRLQQAVHSTDSHTVDTQQQDKEERKEDEEMPDSEQHTAPTSTSTVHGSVFLPCLPYYCHFLSPQLLPAQLTTTEPLPSAATAASQSSRLRLVSPPSTHFTVRRRFVFFDQQNGDDTALTDVDIKDTKPVVGNTSPATPPVLAPTIAPAASAAPTVSAALASPTSTFTTPRRIALPSAVPNVHPRPLQSPSSAASPLALAASKLSTRPSLPSPSLTRQPSLHRPMSNPKAGRSVVMLGLEEAGGLTDVKQRVREEKEKERREKEEEKRQEAERKKEEREKERREKEEEKRAEAEKRREEKEEKERQRRAEKEEKEKKRVEWHRVRDEKAKEREEKKKRDEELQKQREDELAQAAREQQVKERKEADEAVERKVDDSSQRGDEQRDHPGQQPTSTELSEAKQEVSTANGQSSSDRQVMDSSEQQLTHTEIDSTSHVPAPSLQFAAAANPTDQQQQQQQQSDGHSADSHVHSPPLHPLPALPVLQASLDSDEAKQKRREERKRRKQDRQQTDSSPPPLQQSGEEEERERKRRKKEKREKEKDAEREEKRGKDKSGEKAESEQSKAAVNVTVVKRHRPSCKRKA